MHLKIHLGDIEFSKSFKFQSLLKREKIFLATHPFLSVQKGEESHRRIKHPLASNNNNNNNRTNSLILSESSRLRFHTSRITLVALDEITKRFLFMRRLFGIRFKIFENCDARAEEVVLVFPKSREELSSPFPRTSILW